MNYVTGNTIRRLREKKRITQKQLADMLAVSDKTVSKWETGKGLPDIGIIKELAELRFPGLKRKKKMISICRKYKY